MGRSGGIARPLSYSVDCSGFMRFFQTFALSLRFEKIEFEESI
ncbi:hypothetical protein BACSTE_02577 [Bacteroides stercoris ATCC 43183]|uniref:Uncharacterized protein n=1 Tax=Bacteroides stercoris ATCC 43183 TaxID=449673 RepID=B0NSW2_BACSE|nr:hypothetical protein BACSTE_02577 [Bacteroides stercoris ATCC 43183]